MDVCHAPDCPALKVIDGKAIERPEILELYHNGPEWARILCDERSGKDRVLNGYEAQKKEAREEREEEESVKQYEITKQIVELAKEGKSFAEIMAQTGAAKIQVKNATSRARAKGELPQAEPKKLINRAPHNAPKQAAEINPAMRSLLDAGIKAQPFVPSSDLSKPFPAPPTQEQPAPSAIAPDFSRLHEMIDLCERLPELTAGLLKSCDEIETAARYQLALVAEIRGKLSA